MTTADISFETGIKKSRGTKSRKATYPAALRMAWLVAAKRAAQAAVSRIRNPSGPQPASLWRSPYSSPNQPTRNMREATATALRQPLSEKTESPRKGRSNTAQVAAKLLPITTERLTRPNK